jgi:hypothetical protein
MFLIESILLIKEGFYEAGLKEGLSIHSDSRYIKGTFENKDNRIIGKSKFQINIENYGIKAPKTVTGKISISIEIQISVAMDYLKRRFTSIKYTKTFVLSAEMLTFAL